MHGYAAFSGVTVKATWSTGGGGGGGNVLQNGVPVTGLSGAKNAKLYYTVVVPAGAYNLAITTSGGSGDEDLYVKFGATPTTSSYDCRPYVSGNNETCSAAVAVDRHVLHHAEWLQRLLGRDAQGKLELIARGQARQRIGVNRR